MTPDREYGNASSLSLADLEANDPHAPDAKADGEQDFLCPMPACADHQNPGQHRSLSANVRTGAWKCHRCGSTGLLAEYHSGRPPAPRPRRLTLVPPSKPHNIKVAPHPDVVARRNVGPVRRFVCTTIDGRVAVHCRQDLIETLADGTERPGKAMWWESTTGARGLPDGLHTADLLYAPDGLDAIPEGSEVDVHEGETAADAGHSLGRRSAALVCGASGRPSPAVTAWLARRHCNLYPDNDEPGRGLMRRSAHHLLEHKAAPRWVALPVEDKGDMADYVAAGATADDLAALIAAAPSAYSEVVAAMRAELAATGGDDSARVARLETENAELRQNYKATLDELLDAKRRTPERALDRFVDELADMERNPRTRGMMLQTLVMLKDCRAAMATGKPADARMSWRYEERQHQLQRSPNTQRRVLDTLVAHKVIGQEYRDLGERGKADWRQELDVYFKIPLTGDLADDLQTIRRRVHETKPEAKEVKRRGPCRVCTTASCDDHPDATLTKSVVLTCDQCGQDVTPAHAHTSQPASKQPKDAVALWRPALSDPHVVAVEPERNFCVQVPIEDVERRSCVQVPSAPDTLIDAMMAAWDEVRARQRTAPLSPAATLAAEVSALVVVAQAAQTPARPPDATAPDGCVRCGDPLAPAEFVICRGCSTAETWVAS